MPAVVGGRIWAGKMFLYLPRYQKGVFTSKIISTTESEDYPIAVYPVKKGGITVIPVLLFCKYLTCWINEDYGFKGNRGIAFWDLAAARNYWKRRVYPPSST